MRQFKLGLLSCGRGGTQAQHEKQKSAGCAVQKWSRCTVGQMVTVSGIVSVKSAAPELSG